MLQKLIAILLFLLLGATVIASDTCLFADSVEKLADSDKGKEGQPEKKDTKDFLAPAAVGIPTLAPLVSCHTGAHHGDLPNPTLYILKPPPNVIC